MFEFLYVVVIIIFNFIVYVTVFLIRVFFKFNGVLQKHMLF